MSLLSSKIKSRSSPLHSPEKIVAEKLFLYFDLLLKDLWVQNQNVWVVNNLLLEMFPKYFLYWKFFYLNDLSVSVI